MREGFTADGYICDQEKLTDYPYRTATTNYNGCGWIACYNVLKYLGREPEPMDVCHTMDYMHRLRVPGPTTVRVMRKYLTAQGVPFKEFRGRKAAAEAAESAQAGIFRYYEERIPHYVTFVRAGEGRFRFFNVNDDMWDFESTVSDFAAKHFLGGSVRLFAVPAGSGK